MIKKFTFLLVLVFSLTQVVAQDNFKVTITSLPQQNISLIVEYFSEDGWKHFMSKSFGSESKLSLPMVFDHPGQYRIRLSSDPEKWGDFIIDPTKNANAISNIKIDYSDLKKQPIEIEGSKEHQPYLLMMASYNLLTLNPDSLKRNSIEYLRREKDFFELCEKIGKDFPATFTGSVLAKLLSAPIAPFWNDSNLAADSILAFNALHGLDYMPFKNKNIIFHIGFIRKINLHYNYFNEQGDSAQYIDQLMKKSLVDEKISAFMFRFLLDKMIDYKNEEGLSYLITWYSSDCSENDLATEATKNLLTALEKCKPGNMIELMSLPDISGRIIPMGNVIGENKITLLLFWRSGCSHCHEFEPVLKSIYAKYHAMGVEIYAISTDKNEEAWKAEVTSNPSIWPSVFLEYASRKDFSKRFPVPSTPTLIAVDKNGKILRRLIMRSKLESALEEMLNEIE